MPVECSVSIVPVSQDDFHAVDRVVMGHAFDIHNSLGRFCDEKIYQNELIRCCVDSGFTVDKEVHLRVSHSAFVKSYYLDVLINCGVVYELKAAERLHNNHQRQLINYLLLCGTPHGKLINFGRSSVESRFVSTQLSYAKRQMFRFDEEGWQGRDDASCLLHDTLFALFSDLGVFLDANLYREALLCLLNGEDAGVQVVDVVVGNRVIGKQKMCMLDTETAWHLSAIRQHAEFYRVHIQRLLNHTRLNRIHWINMNQQTITLETLRK